MIEYECPACGAAMASPAAMAGREETCPSCSAVCRVPVPDGRAREMPAVLSPAAAAPVAAAPAPAAVPTDQVLWRCRPAMIRNHPIDFAICCLLIPVAGLGLLLLLAWWLDCWATRLTITERRTVLRRGILARSTNEVRHADVRNIQVRQGILQRLLGVGRIEIATAGHAGVEVSVAGIAHPRWVADLIRARQT